VARLPQRPRTELYRPLAHVTAVAIVAIMAAPSPVWASRILPGRYAIGDSVMLGAARELRDRGIRVDASISRQFDDAIPIVRQMAASGHLPDRVIVHLGNNGLIDGDDCDRLVRVAGPQRRVFLVTVKVPRPYRDPNNRRLRRCARRHDTASVIDWYTHSRYHRNWFYDDGFHLTALGRLRYAAFIGAGSRRYDAGRGATREPSLHSSRWPARADEGARLESV
jgi:hypothetical protein